MIETTYKPFEIEVLETHSWEKRPHKHNFFELVYIESGKGEQCINYFKHQYSNKSIFLLPPLNCHSFTIAELTKFIFIRFTGSYFDKSGRNGVDYSEWFRHLNYILTSYNKIPGDLIKNESDRTHLIVLLEGVVKEYGLRDRYSEDVIKSSMMAILNILSRNIEKTFLSNLSNTAEGISPILNYIHHHLYEKEKLRLAALAYRFNISPTYFGEYFKKHSGEALQDYILKTKLRIAEAKMLNTSQSLKETAYELGFTDSSHLSKMFKKYYKKSIGNLRNQPTETCS